jgi:hypothetical protein
MLALHDANAEIERLIGAWSSAVLDHTGTIPVVLGGFDDETEDEQDDEHVDGDEDLTGETLSVVSRWDLQVLDAAALLQAGRDAHRRNEPQETDGDAELAVPDVALALQSLLHERGEPWYDVPGVDVVAGLRVYVRRDEQPPVLLSDDEVDEEVRQPRGRVLFSESWA